MPGDAGGFELLFRLADGGNFRERIDDVRNDVVVHVSGLAGDDLGDSDAFILRLVGEHRAGDHVADGVDAWDIGGVMPIDADAAAIIARDADGIEAEAFGIGHTPDRDQRGIDRKSTRLNSSH